MKLTHVMMAMVAVVIMLVLSKPTPQVEDTSVADAVADYTASTECKLAATRILNGQDVKADVGTMTCARLLVRRVTMENIL